jgi:D-threo-aldose 1-dehydrogenase
LDVTSLRKVGKSELSVTPLGFGGGTIGSPVVANAASAETVEAAWAVGVRFYDTAPWYGVGRSERRLGAALSGISERDTLRVNTKVGRSLVPEPKTDESGETLCPGGSVRTPRDPLSGFRVEFDYSHDRFLAQHRDSLQRLGLASVDSLTVHDLDYGYHSAEQVDHHLSELSREGGGGAVALEDLRAAGVIKAIGCGCNPEGVRDELFERIADLIDLDFFVIAGPYTLLETQALSRILPLCQERGIGVIAAAPYAGGWLATHDESKTYMYAPAPPEIVERSRGMRVICERHGVSLAAAALQFPLAHPLVAAVIPGAKTPAEATENARLLNSEVPQVVWDEFKRDGLLDPNAPTSD